MPRPGRLAGKSPATGGAPRHDWRTRLGTFVKWTVRRSTRKRRLIRAEERKVIPDRTGPGQANSNALEARQSRRNLGSRRDQGRARARPRGRLARLPDVLGSLAQPVFQPWPFPGDSPRVSTRLAARGF